MRARPTFPERPDELHAALEGRLTHRGARELRAGLTGLAARRPRRLVLDLRKVVFLDATAVSILRALERRIGAAGGRLVLVADGEVRRTLTALGAAHLVEPAAILVDRNTGLSRQQGSAARP